MISPCYILWNNPLIIFQSWINIKTFMSHQFDKKHLTLYFCDATTFTQKQEWNCEYVVSFIYGKKGFFNEMKMSNNIAKVWPYAWYAYMLYNRSIKYTPIWHLHKVMGVRGSWRTGFRRGPLTFGILENYHCWRFHSSGVMRAFEIVDLIYICTWMHHDYFWGRQCASVFPIYVQKYRKHTIDR